MRGPSKVDRVTAAIEANYALANKLSIEGTPAFVIGGQFIRGAADFATMQAKVNEAREKKGG